MTLEAHKILNLHVLSQQNLIHELRKGLCYEAVGSIQRYLDISIDKIGVILNSSPRTLSRRKKEGRLNFSESERLYRLAVLIEHTEKVLDGREAALKWLKSSKRALAGESPLDYADTGVGVNEVIDLLGRIEHGVFS